MSIVEVQIRTDRFCELVKSEINRRPLRTPTQDMPPEITGKFLERIECVTCELEEPSEGSGRFAVRATLAFKYHPDIQDLRTAGSLQPSATAQALFNVSVGFTMAFNPALPLPPVLSYEIGTVLEVQERGTFPFRIPDDLGVKSAAIEATEEIVAIRLGTNLDDPVHDTPVDRLAGGEWIQLIPGDLIAEKVRKVLDEAVEAAVKDPPPPDPSKPWLPKPNSKPKELQKGSDTVAAWWAFPPQAIGQGAIIAVDACPVYDIDISIELTLRLVVDFSDPHTMRSVGVLTWDADSTWCDVFMTLRFGVVVAVAVHVGVEQEASDSIFGKSIAPGDGFAEVGRTPNSIIFQKIAGAPSPPSRDFDRTHSEVTFDGIATGGLVVPKAVAPALAGEMIPASARLDLNCSLRSVSMGYSPAQVILRNKAPGYIGAPPRLFPEHTIFVPPNAWTIDTDMVNLANPFGTSPQTVLTFVDPPTGRLPVGTPTSVFLFTDFGVRWVDLGTIPDVPALAPDWAEALMADYCDSISNPWGHGMTRLGWDVDPLLDPDYATIFAIDPVRLWTVGLRELPDSARIEFLALAPDGSERLLGVVEGKRSAALQLVTDGKETLGIRSREPFSAPAPTLLRSWVFPFAAHPAGPDLVTMASARGLLGLTGRDGRTRLVDPRQVGEAEKDDRRGARATDPREGRVTEALVREETRGREAWASATRIDKNTIAVIHRGQVLIGTMGVSRRVQ